ncbi:hypothetical protein Tco_0601373 [Tanacetum coccineum]
MDLKWQLSLLSVRTKKYYQKTGKKIFIKWGAEHQEQEDQFRNQDNTRKQGNKDDTSKAMLAIDGVANPSEPSPVSYFYNADCDNISTPSTTYTIHLTKSATIITNPSELTRRIYHNQDIFYDGDDDEELFPDEVKRI